MSSTEGGEEVGEALIPTIEIHHLPLSDTSSSPSSSSATTHIYVAPVPSFATLIRQSSSFDSRFSMFSGEVAVFISDMVGFTSTTRRLGIIHYASLILKMRSLFLPVLRQFEAIHIFTEADNLWVVFPDVSSATAAAFEGLRVLQEYNEGQSNEDFHIRLSGVGIHSGEGVWLDKKEGKIFGNVVDKAFRLGEDLCEDGEVLLSQHSWAKLKEAQDPRFSEPRITATPDQDLDFHYVHLKGDYNYIIQLNSIQRE
jgi:adenylate cyclase